MTRAEKILGDLNEVKDEVVDGIKFSGKMLAAFTSLGTVKADIEEFDVDTKDLKKAIAMIKAGKTLEGGSPHTVITKDKLVSDGQKTKLRGDSELAIAVLSFASGEGNATRFIE